MSDTTETATGAPTRNTKVRGRPFQKGHKIGLRFQKGPSVLSAEASEEATSREGYSNDSQETLS
jgi:hypothetical protein